jgi:hypothetical protein
MNADQEKNCITALQLRSRIQEIKDALSENNTPDDSSRASLEKELSVVEKKVKANESKSKVLVPPKFQ